MVRDSGQCYTIHTPNPACVVLVSPWLSSDIDACTLVAPARMGYLDRANRNHAYRMVETGCTLASECVQVRILDAKTL